jgi:hypothetical protein
MMLWCASSSMTRRATGVCAERIPAATLLAIATQDAEQIFRLNRIPVPAG